MARDGQAAEAIAKLREVMPDRATGTAGDLQAVASYYCQDGGQNLFVRLDGAFRTLAAVLGFGGDASAVKKTGRTVVPWPIPPGLDCVRGVVRQGGPLWRTDGDGRLELDDLGRAIGRLLRASDGAADQSARNAPALGAEGGGADAPAAAGADAAPPPSGATVSVLWHAAAFAAVVVECGAPDVLLRSAFEIRPSNQVNHPRFENKQSTQETASTQNKQSTQNNQTRRARCAPASSSGRARTRP
jgi:hypothetical protein